MKPHKQIIKYGKKLVDYNLTSGTGGNISLYDRKNRQVIITPSGIDYYSLTEEDLVIIDLEGNIISGKREPSSEWILHTMLYKYRDDMNAIIHGHTIYSTVLSCLREPLLPTHYMVGVAGKKINVAEYATFGTKELAENVVKAIDTDMAVLMANHGIIAGSNDLSSTFNIVDQIEYASKLYCIGKSIGKPVILEDDEMDLMLEKFKTYGKL